ncbi:MAG: hypothetical protein GWN87_11750, partial [Desulfuromonadales bacterium]|nr:hypothetical protein [Desulfuromonadales bacterium]NIS41098.1 hypothetical protein [Desulfuromonadales bacterium]
MDSIGIASAPAVTTGMKGKGVLHADSIVLSDGFGMLSIPLGFYLNYTVFSFFIKGWQENSTPYPARVDASGLGPWKDETIAMAFGQELSYAVRLPVVGRYFGQ